MAQFFFHRSLVCFAISAPCFGHLILLPSNALLVKTCQPIVRYRRSLIGIECKVTREREKKKRNKTTSSVCMCVCLSLRARNTTPVLCRFF